MYVGQSIKRREDLRFLTGTGQYVGDIQLMGTAYVAFLRSPHGHAELVSIDTNAAEKMDGVLAVLTDTQWSAEALGDLPCISPTHFHDGRRMNEARRPVFARDRVRLVGEIIAAVVAESVHQALDAIEAIEVVFKPLRAVTDVARALDSDAPVLHEKFGTNLAFDTSIGDEAGVKRAYMEAHHVEELTFPHRRITANPMEPRVYLGQYEPSFDRYTLYTSNQAPHLNRSQLAEDVLKVPEHKIRVIAPDVGGGFGMKVVLYPEEAIVLWAARIVERPVKFTSTRSEGLMSDSHARDHATVCRMAFDKCGKILAVQADTVAALGAYVGTWGPSIPGYVYPKFLSGAYTVPLIHARVRGVYTNTMSVEPYRGAGRPECSFVVERLLEAGAKKLGLDVLEVRRRNCIPPEAFPYQTPGGWRYDSGDLPGLLKKTIAISHYDDLRAEQAKLRAEGTFLGIGAGFFVDLGGGAPNRVVAEFGRRIGSFEVGTVRVHPSGKVTIFAGTMNHGQGHETSYCQIVADSLGVPVEDIALVNGDTDKVAAGLGSWGSRSLTMAGVALLDASNNIVSKCKNLSAHILESSVDDIVQEDNHFVVAGTDKKLTFSQVARAAYHGSSFPDGFKLGLDETVFYEPSERNFASACHLAVVLVDPATGRVKLRDYYAVDDSGRLINPLIVEGQVHGAVAQGVGQALMEFCNYDDQGQFLSGSFMDYAMPRATDLPHFSTAFQETLAPGNALGAKGAGESGTIGAPVAIVNAVIDALAPFGVEKLDMPLLPECVWSAIQRSAVPTSGRSGVSL